MPPKGPHPAAKAPARERRITSLTDEGRQNAGFAAAVLVVVGLFVAAYSIGSGKERKVGEVKAYDLQKRGEFLRQQLNECQNKSGTNRIQAENLKGESAELWNTNRQLEMENERLVKQNDELEKVNVECAENSVMHKEAWQREDEKYAARLDSLDRANRELRAKAKRLTSTQGMRTILLLAVMKKLSQENAEMRSRNKLPPKTVTAEYLGKLVKKWMNQDSGAMAARKGEVLPPNRTEMWSDVAKGRVLTKYDPDKHAKEIFLPKKDPATGEWRLPGWNGRYGTQDVRHGTFIGSKLCPVTNINRQMRVLYEYALCAVGNNITKLMYPTAFKRCKDCHTEYLHNYIETPLVLFCDDCIPMHSTNEFKLLCQGYSSEEQYGSMLFWRTRSRLRFKSRFLNLAEDWVKANHFTGAVTTLAVRLPRVDQEAMCKKLQKNPRPILSYTKLLKDKDGVTEYSDTFSEQCNPDLPQVARRINAKVKSLQAASSRPVKVYLSSDLPSADFRTLQDQVRVELHRRQSTGRPTEDDVVDTYVAASCDHAILNRFDIKSAHINEAHMLMHELRIAGVSIW